MLNNYFEQRRFDWAVHCGRIAERDIYTQIDPLIKVIRTDDEPNKRFLDTNYGIDCLLQMSSGRNYAVAERFRGASYRKFNDITIRHSSGYDGHGLEIDKSIAKYLLYGYADVDRPRHPNAINTWLLIDLQRLLDMYHEGKLKPNIRQNVASGSSFATFSLASVASNGLIVMSQVEAVA